MEKLKALREELKALRSSAGSSELVAADTETEIQAPQEEDHLHPVVILALDTITNQARALATIDASRLPWLEANLELVKVLVPSSPSTTMREPMVSSRGQKPVFGQRPGPKGRKVMVLKVDEDEYTGTWKHGTEFENCAIASRELGCDYNAVLKSFKQGEDGLDISTVHGVTFCYADDYMVHINKDIRCD